MTDGHGTITKLIGLQRQQAERALQKVLLDRNQLLAAADNCYQASRLAYLSADPEDIRVSSATEKWIQVQHAKAKSLKQEAAELQNEIDRLRNNLLSQIRKQTGVDELAKIQRKKQALLEEEKADEEMLTIAQLSKKYG